MWQKHYKPIPMIIRHLVLANKTSKKVLEVGPGISPFPIATHFIDHVQTGPNVVNIDICNEKFPFADNEFDFVYARHVLEDVQNPKVAFNECVRVGKKGYIETPSIIAEVTKKIDPTSPPWRGYFHHRYMFWSLEHTLVCIPKYPFIEYIDISNVETLLADPFNWNHYYQWESQAQAKIKEL